MAGERVGQIVGGRYKLLRLLGSGGMGEVYEALHTDLDRRMAVKFLFAKAAGDAPALSRFRREAKAAAGLSSEHVVAITDFGASDDGAPYLVMELLDGMSLRELLSSGPLSVARAVDLVIQTCRGLALAHARGIVHRDLKPENLFLARRSDGADLLKILDFGIAKVLGEEGTTSATGTGQIIGTLYYMPPEQLRGDKDLDARVDVYALAAVLYELLTGRVPHTGDQLHVVMYRILHETPVRPESLRPDLPPGLADVVLRALSPLREQRHADVNELAAALSSFSGHVGGAAPFAVTASELAMAPTGVLPQTPYIAPVASPQPGYTATSAPTLPSAETAGGAAVTQRSTAQGSSIVPLLLGFGALLAVAVGAVAVVVVLARRATAPVESLAARQPAPRAAPSSSPQIVSPPPPPPSDALTERGRDDWLIKGFDPVSSDCTRAWAILTDVPRGLLKRRVRWPLATEALRANPRFQLVDRAQSHADGSLYFPDRPGQVHLEEYQYRRTENVMLVATCSNGATCNRLAALYHGVARFSHPALGCGNFIEVIHGPGTAIDLAGEAPMPGAVADAPGACARLAACVLTLDPSLGGDPAKECQAAPVRFKTSCAVEPTCAAVVRCVKGGEPAGVSH